MDPLVFERPRRYAFFRFLCSLLFEDSLKNLLFLIYEPKSSVDVAQESRLSLLAPQKEN